MLITRMQTHTDSSGITVHTPPLLSHVVLLEFPVCVLQGIVFITAPQHSTEHPGERETDREKKEKSTGRRGMHNKFFNFSQFGRYHQ